MSAGWPPRGRAAGGWRRTRLEGQPADLAFAVTLVDDLLERAISDRSGMRWSNHEFRLPEPDLPPETTYMQGAAGIGSTLLRLHRHLAGDPWTVRWPHAPDWTAKKTILPGRGSKQMKDKREGTR